MDPDLKLRNEWAEVESEFLAAKKNRDKDPDGYAKAKAKLHALRTYWRQIREAVEPPPPGESVVVTATEIIATRTTRN